MPVPRWLALIFLLVFAVAYGCAGKSIPDSIETGTIPDNFPNFLKNMDPGALARVIVPPHDSEGSGFFASPNGCFITAHHVLSDQNMAKLWNGSLHSARVIFRHEKWDLMVLKAEGAFPAISLPKTIASPDLGETVYAVTRDGGLKLKYISGVLKTVRDPIEEVQIMSRAGRRIKSINFVPGALTIDQATTGGWSGSYAVAKSGRWAGYLFGGNFGNFTHLHPISWQALKEVFPKIGEACRG